MPARPSRKRWLLPGRRKMPGQNFVRCGVVDVERQAGERDGRLDRRARRIRAAQARD